MNALFFGLLFQIVAAPGPQTDQDFCACSSAMVVAVDAASRPLADEFVANLTAQVIPDAPLGDVTGLGDDVIAERASKFGVDTVVIIRALPIKNGSKTFLSRYDVFKKTWSTSQRVIVIDPQPAFVQAQRIARESVDAGRVADHDESMSLRRGDFHNRRLIFGPTPWTWKNGVMGENLDEPQFYNAIGRNDLAQAHASSVSTKTTVLLSSGILTAVGVGLGFVGFLGGGLDGDMPQMALGIGGLAGVALGTGGIVWGASMDTHPVSLDEAKNLGDAHNQRLAAELGVDAGAEP